MLSWLEQKAVVAFFSLIASHVQNMYLGTSIIAFLAEKILGTFVTEYDVKQISLVADDLCATLQEK